MLVWCRAEGFRSAHLFGNSTILFPRDLAVEDKEQYLFYLGILSPAELAIVNDKIASSTARISILHFFPEDWVLKKRLGSEMIAFDHIFCGGFTRHRMPNSTKRNNIPLPMAQPHHHNIGQRYFFGAFHGNDFSAATLVSTFPRTIGKFFTENLAPLGQSAAAVDMMEPPIQRQRILPPVVDVCWICKSSGPFITAEQGPIPLNGSPTDGKVSHKCCRLRLCTEMLHEVMVNDGGAEDLVFAMDPSVMRPLTLALIKMDTSGVVLGTLATEVSTELDAVREDLRQKYRVVNLHGPALQQI